MTASTLDDMKVHVKVKLSALWAAIMFCYIYGDFWGLFRPGNLRDALQLAIIGHAWRWPKTRSGT